MVTPRGHPDTRRDSDPSPATHQPSQATGTVGQQILAESFAVIEREIGRHSFPPWAFAVIRRMIHASADFEFAQTLRQSDDFDKAIGGAFGRGVTVVTDTEMVLLGIRSATDGKPGFTLACHLNDPEASELATAASLTRSAAGIRLAASRHPGPVLAIGNAPTALEEALRLVEGGWRPVAIVGMPVGFVGVEEAKSRLLSQSWVPYLTCTGRKGGSAVTAAAINALVEYFLP
jgi:precorrin-8X/cobalt-precorrin-8 methylmutase